ncbi:EF-hand domain-containing protein [Brevundimonas goettingensis]|uniref:EF-hand domain-containing protein n=1 Tax=Brevundimonas goettingensis TaxID=2774190 RepID=A0A975C0V0_9CAUL|nr:EF-hand domain-containing protein [Brevundimonas goettingensis]QTC91415.1 EF-hand domain-containing protein [Brevundimonas goettingensis]
MKKTIIAGGLAAASLAVLVGAAAPAPQTPAQAPAAATTQAAPAARHAGIQARQAQPVSQAEFVQARVSRLTALDANHDGTVTAEELRAGAQARRARHATQRFDRLDADKSGQISRAEFDAARPEHGDRAGHRGPRGGEHRGQRMGRRGGGEGRGHGPAERVAHHGPIVIADVQTKLTEGFARLDTDHDGVLSPAERQAGRAVMRERFQERRVQRQNRAPAVTSASPSAPASE